MIGDVLTSSILCEALKNHWSECEVHYMVNADTTSVLDNNSFIDKLVAITPAMEKDRGSRNLLKKALLAEKYDIVVDVYSKLGSAFLTRYTQAKTRVGYSKWYTKLFYTATLDRKKRSYTTAGLAIENRFLLLEKVTNHTFDYLKPKLYLSPEEITKAKIKISNHGISFDKKIYQISILGSNDIKTYPPHYMAQLLDYIVLTVKSQLLFNYIPSQRSLVNEIYELCKPDTRKSIFLECYGTSLREFMAITYHCDALIGNEGGAVNMAKALGIPTFAIFCPWVKKEAWSIFEDQKNNVSTHLYDFIDFMPYFGSKTKSKNTILESYLRFKPGYIIPELHKFITKKPSLIQGNALSATIITFNEEKNIARCIESLLPVVDEVIIVDSYSTDLTEKICSNYPVTFIKNKFEGHIQQKNFALQKATHDWIISLDADEALSKEAQAAILREKRNFNNDGYYIQRYNNYCGQWINFSDWNPDKKLRLFNKNKAYWDGINPHDKIHMSKGSKESNLKGEILHWVHKTHEEHRQKTIKFSTIAAQEYFKLGRSSNWLDILFKPLWIFTRSYVLRLGFLDGKNGFMICKYSAKTTYLKYVKLRNLLKE